MKVIDNQGIALRGSKNDLSFIKRIRDIDVQKFESLQKTKVELLLKLRDATKVLSAYKNMLKELSNNQSSKYLLTAKTDIAEMEQYISLLKSKLHNINLEILAEEEKNY